MLGAHLEGPFISPQALGAQPPFAIPPDPALVDALRALAPLLVATIAPEIDPDHALLEHLCGHGVRVQLGHSRADCAAAEAALAAGAAGFTHLFNAMTGLHHRAPGMVGAALARAAPGRADPRLPARRAGRRAGRAARDPRPLRHHRCGRRGRHAGRRVPPRPPPRDQGRERACGSPTARSPAAR